MGQGAGKINGVKTASVTPAGHSKYDVNNGEKFKLVYFNVKGRAETTRMLFALAGKPFEDVRLTPDEWLVFKSETPFGQLPILEVNNAVVICQEFAIERYVAQELGLHGRTHLESAKIDMIIECMRESILAIQEVFNETDDVKKATTLSEYQHSTRPAGLSGFKKLLTSEMKKPWFLGDQISLVDASIYNALSYIKLFIPTSFDDAASSSLNEWYNRFEEHPRIAHWISTRPTAIY